MPFLPGARWSSQSELLRNRMGRHGAFGGMHREVGLRSTPSNEQGSAPGYGVGEQDQARLGDCLGEAQRCSDAHNLVNVGPTPGATACPLKTTSFSGPTGS